MVKVLSLIIYNFTIFCYHLLITIWSIFNPKAQKWITGRRNIFERIYRDLKSNHKPIIWVHCASLGEFEQARTLIDYFKLNFSNYKIFLTFFSPSGYEIRKNYLNADWVYYLPIDTKRNAKKFVEIVHPNAVFFVKYEFWYHYINQLYGLQIPIYSISAIFRAEQIFFKSYGAFMKDLLAKFTTIFVQDVASFELLNQINIKSIISGDTRFDRVIMIAEKAESLPLIALFKSNSQLMVMGSSWQVDTDLIAKSPSLKNIFLDQQNNIKLIIAPHEINDYYIQKLIDNFSSVCIKYSQMEQYNVAIHRILIIDNVGILSSIYSHANFAYIGGAFGKGLHNILEACTFGIPVIFGTNYLKFKEAVDLVQLKGAFSVSSSTEFENIARQLITNIDKTKLAGSICKNYVENHAGATKRIIHNLSFLNIHSSN